MTAMPQSDHTAALKESKERAATGRNGRVSKIKDLLKKTPLRPLWWKFCKIPPMKKIRKYRNRKAKDKLLFKTLPAVYDAHKNEPVDEGKVLFVEERFGEISNSFQVIYDELKNHYDLIFMSTFWEIRLSQRKKTLPGGNGCVEDAPRQAAFS